MFNQSAGPGGRGHQQLAHTADVILEAWGTESAACIEEAVAALVETYVANSADQTGRPVVVAEQAHAVDPGPLESLLLAVLETVIFVLDTSEEVPVGARIQSRPDGGMDVVLELADRATVAPTGAVPKAISRSGLTIVASPASVVCRFLADV